jgi:hypothetical protein
MRSKISSVAVSGCVVSANFDLESQLSMVYARWNCGFTDSGLNTSIQSAK